MRSYFCDINGLPSTLSLTCSFQQVKCSAMAKISTIHHRTNRTCTVSFKMHTHISNKHANIHWLGWVAHSRKANTGPCGSVWLCWSRLATSEKCERAPVFLALSPSAIQPRGSGLPKASQNDHFHQIKSEKRRQEGRKVSPPYRFSALILSNLTLRVSLYHSFPSFQHAGWWHHDQWLTDNLRCDLI